MNEKLRLRQIELCNQALDWLAQQQDDITPYVYGLLNEKLFSLGVRDKCQICHGNKGGVPGNENIENGVILCDYCSAERMSFDKLRKDHEQDRSTPS